MRGNLRSGFPFVCYLGLSLLLVNSCTTDRAENTLFRFVPPNQSGIDFQNNISEDERYNILDFEYLYNGAGVATGDFNGDDLPDIYLVGNMSENRLYLNAGGLKFRDGTNASGSGGTLDKWYSGVSVVDINNDGRLDIYLAVTGNADPQKRRNELYINEGLSEEGIPVFVESAEEYGLAQTNYSTHAAFFDYDNDGDLDLYELVSYPYSGGSYTNTLSLRQDVKQSNTDRLYRAEWDSTLDHPVYANVSEQAGIDKSGYGLGINIVDINNDGWKDIYVANDYISSDLLWINNGDGTFTDRAGVYFKHTSFAAMGVDVADINNDGLMDIFTLDMLPEVNVRKKTMMNPTNYRTYVNNAFAGYEPQYTRNTLQLNQGPVDSTGRPGFSEIAFLAGVAETDWSWAPLMADFDNDGFRDILVTNGIPKDATDKDFWDRYRSVRSSGLDKGSALNMMPEVKIPNYIFRNRGDLTFENVTKSWGLDTPSFSTGAAYADLDNDGDLDLVINNIRQPAFLYENRSNFRRGNWLRIEMGGEGNDNRGAGARVDVYYGDGRRQTWEHTIYRGYLSSVEETVHFGLGETSVVDSVVVTWPAQTSEKRQAWSDVPVNRILKATQSGAQSSEQNDLADEPGKSLFRDVTAEKHIRYVHTENSFDDFRQQPLLPHKLSQFGPGLAVGDINGDGLDDLFIGASYGNRAGILLQQGNGAFTEKKFQPENEVFSRRREDQGVLLFDANGNGHLDLYVVSGGNENPSGHSAYQDRLYENDGKGRFRYVPDALPQILVSGSVVTASDYNRDGKLDLFVGGRLVPGRYPEPVSGYVLRNDSGPDGIRFTDVTSEIAPALEDVGLITDALWTDFNNDGWRDLVISGEWMPVTFLENRNGIFKNITPQTGLAEQTGWWNSLAAGDFNNNGHTDYVVGNLGLNSLYRTGKSEPVSMYAGDLTGNGMYESVPTLFVRDTDGIKKEFPAHFREDMGQQFYQALSQFPTYEAFGKATMQQLLDNKQISEARVYRATNMQTSLIENKGDGTFEMRPLPAEAQFAPVFGMVADDFDDDGSLDLLINGNHHGTDPQVGSHNALNGLLLKGDGKGEFTALKTASSGIYIPGDGKALVKLRDGNGNYLVAAGQNQGPLVMFESQVRPKTLELRSDDAHAILYFENGQTRKEEFHYGSSFLSASGRFMVISNQVEAVEIYDYHGNRRNVSLREE